MGFSVIRENANICRHWSGSGHTPEGERAIDAEAVERVHAMSRERLEAVVTEVERYRRDLAYAAQLRDYHASLARRDGRESGAGVEAHLLRQIEVDINNIVYGEI